MKLFSNKFFILGNLVLILLVIPITLFSIKKQQDLSSKAAASTTLYITPPTATTSIACANLTLDVMVDPGQNLVSIVDMYLAFDQSKLNITQITPSAAFPTVVRQASITTGQANISLSVGNDSTKAVDKITKVATITFKPIGSTSSTSTTITFDGTKTQAFSLSPNDSATENVLVGTRPANVSISQSSTCPSSSSTSSASSSSTTPTPSTISNKLPVCTDFTASPSSALKPPFTVNFTGKGADSDGIITKATINFGDGQVQEITNGMNLSSVTAQTSHRYTTGGTLNAFLTFTDNLGQISSSCSTFITSSGAASSSATPTLAPTGSLETTAAIIGAVLLITIGGLFFFIF